MVEGACVVGLRAKNVAQGTCLTNWAGSMRSATIWQSGS